MSASPMSAWFAIVTGHSEWCVLLCLWEIPTHACVISHLWPNTSAYAEFRLFSSEMFKYILPLVHLLCPRRQKYPCCRARQTDVEAGVDACILCQSGGSYRPCPSLQHCLIRSVCIWPSHRFCWCLIMQQARPHTHTHNPAYSHKHHLMFALQTIHTQTHRHT